MTKSEELVSRIPSLRQAWEEIWRAHNSQGSVEIDMELHRTLHYSGFHTMLSLVKMLHRKEIESDDAKNKFYSWFDETIKYAETDGGIELGNVHT